ncbi:MAG: FHA domain-containing protein [Sinobacterium sp.]|nr:FHA domain-containing protein [Sinobacterium sp.]
MTDNSNQTLFNVSAIPVVRELLLKYAGQDYVVTQDNLPFVIGRDESCNLMVDSQFASRHHCKILYHNKNFILKDDSTNGTYFRLGVSQPTQLNRTMTSITGNGVLKLGEAMLVGDKDVVSFKAVY